MAPPPAPSSAGGDPASAFPRRAADLAFEARLGRGYFGEVWRARTVAGKHDFAVKKVRLALINENRLSEQLRREIRILYSLRHPRIVALHFDFCDNECMYLGMEFAIGGSLFDRLSKAKKFVPEKACRYFAETCDALHYLHTLPEKVIHRDIKPENILLDAEDHIKLADFGWANLVDTDKRDTFCGTLDYLPPEMIMGTGHDESADMWNMGVLLYELTTGQSPFSSNGKEATCRLILAVDLRFPPRIDQDAQDLICKLCRKRPAERLTVRDALAHAFVVKFRGAPPVGSAAAVSSPHPGAETEDATEGAEAGDASPVRPSVVARKLRGEQEKVCAEMQRLLRAKQSTEEALMRLSEDIEQKHAYAQAERRRRLELDAACEFLAQANEARVAEIADLRRKLGSAHVARVGGVDVGSEHSEPPRLGWWSRLREHLAAEKAAKRAAAAAAAAAASTHHESGEAI